MIAYNSIEAEVLKETRRNIIKSFLEIYILAKLKKTNMLSGFDLIELLRRQFDFTLSPATVYSALCRLERKGLIKSAMVSSQRKRVYTLIQEGKELLAIKIRLAENIAIFVRATLAA